MAHRLTCAWTVNGVDMLPRRDRPSGPFQAYVPDRLPDRRCD